MGKKSNGNGMEKEENFIISIAINFLQLFNKNICDINF